MTTDSVTQTRSHNDQNEITSISGATTPTYDANGNLTGDETGRQFVYDAWNRLVTVKDSGGSTISSYQYDGVGRRISETKSGATTDLYVSSADQVLEERASGTATAQYVWSPVYVDALVLRDRDTDANGSLDERRWVQQDANWNVTALLDNSGAVVERYAYDPYGNFTIYDASWGSRSSSSYGWVYQHQGLRYDGGAGLYHARARDLSPSLGRWLQNDPASFGAGDVDLYRAYGNGPTGALDPSGLVDSPRAKLLNAIGRGDAVEAKAWLEIIEETAPDLLNAEIRAAARAVIERAAANAAAESAAAQIARREIQEAIQAAAKPGNIEEARGAIMRGFFKHGVDPKKNKTVIDTMRWYLQQARKIILDYKNACAKGGSADKYEKLIKGQETRIERILDWFARNGVEP